MCPVSSEMAGKQEWDWKWKWDKRAAAIQGEGGGGQQDGGWGRPGRGAVICPG